VAHVQAVFLRREMTKDEYRQHMRKYSCDTMVMSFVVTNHPDYQALVKEAGKEIIPYLLDDMFDPNWNCSHCYGEGFEFPPGWVWDNELRNWPTDTGIPCSKCKGKGSINSWACMTLLWDKVGRDNGPKIENWMRGRHAVLTKAWRKWGEQNGYLPASPEEKESPGVLARAGRALLGLFR
jgi:hypothetical protein